MSAALARGVRYATALLIATSGCGSERGAGAQPTLAQGTAIQPASELAATATVAEPIAVAPSPARDATPRIPPVLHAPRATRRLIPGREFDVGLWGDAANTHTLLDDAGHGAVPVSEARFLWNRDALYVRFYAGDLDLQIHNQRPDGPAWNDDSFTLVFFPPGGTQRRLTVSATGVIADAICPKDAESTGDRRCNLHWQSHARAAADYDGTINQLGDHDEEWNVELSIPLRAIGVRDARGARVPFVLMRCEIAYDGPRACGRWGREDAPAQLVLE